jgi:RimJ/RimL family protein N-acetyltransferase
MRHDIRIRGEAFALRPVETSDAEFIVALRNDPRLSRFMHPTASLAEQQAWLESYFARPDDYYFIITDVQTNESLGTIGIYDYEPEMRSALWGRWIIRTGSLAAAESVLLLYRVAFEILGLEMVYALTVATNEHVLSFHAKCGLETHARIPGRFDLRGEKHDAIEQRLTRSRWPEVEARLVENAAAAARIARRKR